MKNTNKLNCPVCNSREIKKYFCLRTNQLLALKCKTCTHIFIGNSPINSNNIGEYYTLEDFKGKRQLQDKNWYKNYYHECLYDYENYLQSSKVLQQFREKLDYLNSHFPAKGRLLDVGCSTGVFLDMAKKDGWEVEGVEVSGELAEYARHHFSITVHVLDLTRKELQSKPFDVITLFDVIEHVPEPRFLMSRLRNLVNPNGLLLIRTPTEDGLFRDIAKLAYWGSLTKFELPMLWFYSFEHLQSFSLKTLQHLFNDYHFSTVKVFREEESLNRLNIPSYIKIIMNGLALFSSVLNKQHKIVVIAQ